MTASRLFAVPESDSEPIAVRTSAAHGAVAEHLLIAELIRRGHMVAVPVVDDHGVDLAVDYYTTVQVKSAARRERERDGFRFELRHSFKGRNGRRALRLRADIYAFYAVNDQTWWFIPRAETRRPDALP